MSHAPLVAVRRLLGACLAAVLAFALIVSMSTEASAADTRPQLEQRSPDRTVTADALPTVQIDTGVVWAQTMIGNRVYVGGQFSNARPAGAAKGTNLTPRSNLLAYDVRTGELSTEWAPSVNGAVKSIAASPDKTRIYVGGSFTVANGSTKYNLAAFDAQTGALVTGFSAPVGGSYVNAIVVTSDAVYVAGLFTAGKGVARTNLAAFSPSGALLGWAPTTDAQIDAMVLDPGGDKLIIGGRFGRVNGVSQRGLGALDRVSGALVPWAAASTVVNGVEAGKSGAGSAGIWGLATDGNTVYGTGWVYADITVGNLEGTFAAEAGSGAIRWVADCHGDHYGVFSDGDTVYTTSHEHACETINSMPQKDPAPGNMRNASAYTPQAKGILSRSPHVNSIYKDWSGTPGPAPVYWFPDWLTGTYTGMGQAGYSITGNGDYISVGGEFTGLNNQGQYGLVRFAKRPATGAKQGPRVAAGSWTPTTSSIRANELRVRIPANWDRDDIDLTYELLREGTAGVLDTTVVRSTYWNQPTVTLTDRTATQGTAFTYRVRVKDRDGNTVTSSPVSGSSSAMSLSAYANRVVDDGADHYWRLGGTSTTKPNLVGDLPGTAGSGVSQTSGAIAGDSDPASTFSGSSSGLVSTRSSRPAPGTFTEELWFKAPTPNFLGLNGGRGKLIGWGSSATGSSGSYDRHIYMQNNGRLTFGSYPGAARTITTPGSYQDNAWHHVVTTQGPDGTYLYVDGQLEASDPTLVSGQDYNGYWRIGGDALGSWPSAPSSQWFNGSIDEVAIYSSTLTQAQVATHYGLGKGALPPTAAFGSSVDDLTVNVDATGSSAASGKSIIGYGWDFGDGSGVKTGLTTSHTYADPGTYDVTLTVTDSAGMSSTLAKTVTVSAPHADPVADFTADADGLTVAFDGTTSTASDGASIESYAWDFGDGDTSTVAKPSHRFATPGAKAVTLTVTDNHGATSQVRSKIVTVTHADPVAAFSVTKSGLTASFDASDSSASDGATLTYAWNFGDGSPIGSGRTVAHDYDEAGTYDVTLTATDSLGSTKQVTHEVSVTAPPAASVAVSDAFGRSVASGWGTADVGGAWSTATGLSVSGGVGRLSLGKSATRTTTVPVTLGEAVSTFELSTDKVADGGGVHVNYVTHKTSAGEYRAKLRFGADGVVQVGVARLVGSTETLLSNRALTGYTHTANGKVKVKVETVAEGSSTRVRAKVWPAGAVEPSDWWVSTLDNTAALQAPGAVGFSVSLSSTVTNGPVEVGFDNLTVIDPNASTTEPPAHVDPVAAFSTTVDGLALSVDASDTTVSDDATATYTWQFGDMSPLVTGKTSSHTYGAGGTYNVILTVTDSLGGQDQLTKQVTVTAPPVDPDPVVKARDAFGRSVASGWGAADVGGEWSTATGLSVSGGVGRLTLGKSATRTTALPVSLGESVSTFEVSTDKVADGGGVHVNYMSHRSAAGEYRLKLRYGADGVVQVGVARMVGTTETLISNRALTGYTHTPGGRLKVKVQTIVEGTSTRVRAKLWPVGASEPTDWYVSTLDATAVLQAPGAVGFSVALSSSVTNGPVEVTFDDLVVE